MSFTEWDQVESLIAKTQLIIHLSKIVLEKTRHGSKVKNPVADHIVNFYHSVFGRDCSKWEDFLNHIIDDFEILNEEVMSAYHRKDFKSLRQTLHKLEPVVKQLKADDLLMLFQQYRNCNEISNEMHVLNCRLSNLSKDIINVARENLRNPPASLKGYNEKS